MTKSPVDWYDRNFGHRVVSPVVEANPVVRRGSEAVSLNRGLNSVAARRNGPMGHRQPSKRFACWLAPQRWMDDPGIDTPINTR
ncbi:MAG TPA: hypothetical protein DGN59_21865 [Candidatus Latescibacteria bacterium]|nr:hypothetical protein [Candidatus Latescibacterota bacterium]